MNTSDASTGDSQLLARLSQQTAVATLGLQAVRTDQLKPLAEQGLNAVVATLGLDYGALLQLNGDRRLFETVAVHGWERKWVGTLGRADPDLQPGFTLQTGRVVAVPDYAAESRFQQRPFLQAMGICSGISAPLLAGGRPWGVLVAHARHRRRFGADDIDFVGAVAALLGGTIERLETQAQLAESERGLRAAQRLARLGSWSVELESRAIRWSEETYRIYGMEPARPLLEAEIFEHLPPDSLAQLRQMGQLTLQQGEAEAEHRIILADGGERFLRQRAELVRDEQGRPQRIAGTTLDITELKRSQSERDEVASRLQTTLESMADAFLTIDRSWRITYLNAQAERVLLSPREALLGRVGWDTAAPSLRQRLEPRFRQVLETGESTTFVEHHPDLDAWLEIAVYPSPEGLALYFRNVSERMLREHQLRQQARLLDQTNDAIVVRDVAHRVQFWNQGAERLYGWRSEEVRGRCLETLLYGDEPQRFRAAMAALQRRGSWSGRLHPRRRDGSAVTVESHWTLVQDDGTASIIAIDTDISERLELEERLAQAQKLEAIGQLTGGIAHDFNNLLTVIIGNAELLAEAIGEQQPLTPVVELLKSAADRGAELTGRLLAFARRQALQPRRVSPRQVIDEMAPLLRRSLGEGIEIELVHEPGLWEVFIDPAQLESALLNLGINARDAMPAGGTLTIETANLLIDDAFAARHPELTPGPYVQVAVRDSGVGIAAEILGRVFDPFFTTKAKGKGTGLGLSMVYGFVRQSGGHVTIQSVPEQGTAIEIYLPQAAEDDRAPALAPLPAAAQLGGSEHILLVEDDELVRDHAERLLRQLGYRVSCAAGGPQALALLQRGEPVDLLFTDVIMPGGMNGPQLAAAVQRQWPGLPVLYTSGYTENAIAHLDRADHGTLLLHKPYRRRTLAEKIRQALAQRPGNAMSE